MSRDIASYTVVVTDEMKERVYTKNTDKEVATDGGLAIPYGDEPNRNIDTAEEEAFCGFLGEEVFASVLDNMNVEYEYLGGEGEVDFTVQNKRIDVKTRQSKTAYRNLIRNKHPNSNVDDVDMYVLAIAQYDLVHTDEIVAIEFLGVASEDLVEREGKDVEFHNGNDLHDKKEVEPDKLTPIQDFLSVLEL